MRTWKRSNDRDFEAEKSRILEPYELAETGKATVICLDEFRPLNLKPQPGGRAWAPRRIRATYTRPHGIRHLLGALDGAATDSTGNVEPSPAARSFTVDTQAPAPPILTDANPGSPANDNSPRVTGSAEADSTVLIYGTAGCAGAPAAEGPAADLGLAGIEVRVANDSTNSFHATATDRVGNTSACSPGAIAHVEDSTAPRTTRSVKQTQRLRHAVKLTVRCATEACTVEATGVTDGLDKPASRGSIHRPSLAEIWNREGAARAAPPGTCTPGGRASS